MRILVAGGAGYLGSVLIPKLLARDYSIDVVDLFWFGNHLPKTAGILHKDIFDLTTEDLHGYDQVIFLAGLSNDPMAEFSPSKNFIFNSFHLHDDLKSIAAGLVSNKSKFSDWDNPFYYNILRLKELEAASMERPSSRATVGRN